ncbi:GPI transamidase component PIG-T [Melanogaster broomeanus]|nr:GPI transamidase component PIG-T [Melanogaster broomeanus]
MGKKTVSAFVLSLFVTLVVSRASNASDYTKQFSISGEQYYEDLIIRPLPDGRVGSTFTFTTLLEGASPRDPWDLETPGESQHYTLFPLTLGQILREYSITELHLSLNAGKWNYDTWGYPEDPSVGTGAELWAWMVDGGPMSIDERWTGLRNALAGLFCASLGTLDSRRTSSPTSAFPLSSIPFPEMSSTYALRYATLPSEHVCTENLTPFLKLLPCKSRAGLARLLNPQHVFDADWHGLGIHVRSTERGVELRLGVQAVLDPVRGSGGKRRDWSFRTLFDRVIDAPCPVSSSSTVRVIVPDDHGHILSPELSGDNSLAIYDLASQIPLDISMSWPHEHTFQYCTYQSLPPPVPLASLSIKRALHGSSQTHGVLSIAISNNEPDDITIGYLETLPALVTLWMHTMRIEVSGIQRYDLISDVSYHPPLLQPNGQHGPSMLQTKLTVPAKSTLRLSIDVSKAFLKYTEHPPDAMRGWDLPPAVLFPVSADNPGHGSIPRRMYTPTLLVDLPTPDFSMPYNVIILSCTLMTLIFGSIFNLLTRKWTIVQVEE